MFAQAFAPNRAIDRTTAASLVLAWVVLTLTAWIVFMPPIIPRPWDVLLAFGSLWERGVVLELGRSAATNLKALLLTTIISLALAYGTVLPAFRPLTAAVAKMRFLGLTGLTLLFTLAFAGGEMLKVAITAFGMTVYFVVTMAGIVADIPRAEYDHARTLRMHEWRVVWEVVVLGRLDQAFEVMRQNAAIGWMMLTMVEGLVRSGGGIGAMLLSENKYFHLEEVFALQVLILVVGIGFDWMIGSAKNLACPYAGLTKERR